MLYWGLDYPPLTAYHSFVVGTVARLVDPAYIELFQSRGYESPRHQFFMRISVLVSDCLVLVTALCVYIKSLKVSTRNQWVVFAMCSHPALTLIDYGHFQYNCVSLGLALWAVVFIMRRSYALSAVCFSLALNFKQMELYHALPIFFYLLAACLARPTYASKLLTLAKIGAATAVTFLVVWLPFLDVETGLLQQVVQRVFPFNRGIFEDYVANFWCTLNVLIKVKRFFSPATLTRLCLATTAIAALPSALHLYFKPKFTTLLISLVNVSLAFFLFSYHVHEKSILLVALPVSLLSPYKPFACFWFLSFAHFSMLPLYIKDDLIVPSFALLFLYCLFAYNSLAFECNRYLWLALSVSVLGSAVLTALTLTCPPPDAYPYLWTMLVSVFSFAHFAAFFLYFLHLQFFHHHTVGKIKLN